MKYIYALSAFLLFSSNAFSDEGNNAFDDVIAATSAGGYYTSSVYEVGEGNDVWVEANQISSTEVLSSPTGVGDIDRLYAEDSAISDLLDAE
jgi:hypothetical protein